MEANYDVENIVSGRASAILSGVYPCKIINVKNWYLTKETLFVQIGKSVQPVILKIDPHQDRT